MNKSELWEVTKRVEQLWKDDLISEMAFYQFSHSDNKTKYEFFLHLFDSMVEILEKQKEIK